MQWLFIRKARAASLSNSLPKLIHKWVVTADTKVISHAFIKDWELLAISFSSRPFKQ
jgi:hypothetical protein